MVGMFVCLFLASQKSSEWEFFVPARTDLGVKLLSCFQTPNDIDVIKYLHSVREEGSRDNAVHS